MMRSTSQPSNWPRCGRWALCCGIAVIALLGFQVLPVAQAKSNLTDAQVKQQIIQESIQSYHGSCPCPYSVAKNGSRCGKRSAYSRPGGAAPLCYEGDVTEPMLRDWRKRHGE